MKNVSVMVFLFIALAGFAAGQDKVRFASVYSNLKSDCKNFDGEGGTDGYSVCRGPGGYQVRVYFSAAASHYNAELKSDEQSNFPIAMLPIDFDDRRTRLEWRTARGKPFAVIMRTPTYAEPQKASEYWGPKTGERLRIVGLKGIKLDEDVDAAQPAANKKAREIADAAYRKTLKCN